MLVEKRKQEILAIFVFSLNGLWIFMRFYRRRIYIFWESGRFYRVVNDKWRKRIGIDIKWSLDLNFGGIFKRYLYLRFCIMYLGGILKRGKCLKEIREDRRREKFSNCICILFRNFCICIWDFVFEILYFVFALFGLLRREKVGESLKQMREDRRREKLAS